MAATCSRVARPGRAVTVNPQLAGAFGGGHSNLIDAKRVFPRIQG